MESNRRKLGDFIIEVDERNKDGDISNLIGVSISKKFMPSVANTIGTNLNNYKIIRKNTFACSLMQVSRDGGVAVSLYKEEEPSIMSPAYFIFKVKNENEVISNYLELVLNNPEFDREAVFNAVGGVRGNLTWEDFCDIEIKLPSIEEQEKIVRWYKTIEDRIKIKEKINNNLEQQANALYQAFFSPRSGTQGKIVKLDEYCSIFTGKKNANASVDGGKYKFFTCAPEALQIDSYIYDGNAIIISGNGAYTGRTRFYSGKFDLYQRTYACTLLDSINPDYIFPLYWFVKLELSKKIMGGTRGSAIPYIVMNDLAKFEFVYNEDAFSKYLPVFKSLTKVIQSNEFEIENLAMIRDTLLPKLISNEFDALGIEL